MWSVCLSVCLVVVWPQERARERQVTVETALEEVEKRHEAVTAKKSLMEKAIKQVADEVRAGPSTP